MRHSLKPDRPAPPNLGIADNEVVPKRVFCHRMMLTEKSWREVCRRGLPTISCGKQRFIDGRAAIAWFRAQAGTSGQTHQ